MTRKTVFLIPILLLVAAGITTSQSLAQRQHAGTPPGALVSVKVYNETVLRADAKYIPSGYGIFALATQRGNLSGYCMDANGVPVWDCLMQKLPYAKGMDAKAYKLVTSVHPKHFFWVRLPGSNKPVRQNAWKLVAATTAQFSGIVQDDSQVLADVSAKDQAAFTNDLKTAIKAHKGLAWDTCLGVTAMC